MISGPFRQKRIADAWAEAPTVWLCGVRRAGTTTLARQLGADRTLYMNCDLPEVEDRVRDPLRFLRSWPN